ncbi:sortase A [Enterococcus sp. AZ007]|uniref:Class C sortase n=2 Tax=Enterococcus TaxID=1350 RepID=A0ABS3HMP3_9ENTE|nr:class C sortase [Enterococcus sp. MJM16]
MKRPPKTRSAKQQMISKILMIVVFLAGVLVMMYPFYINAVNDFVDQKRLEEVQEKNKQQNKEEVRKAKERMKKRNEELKKNGLVPKAPKFTNDNERKIVSDAYIRKHLIGAISIPTIEVTLPLFDTTNEKLLQEGATVLQGTSFPTGGPNTHSVISAHSGLPEKKLFTDLEDVKKGEIFVITLFEKKLAYEVEKIDVVEPSDTSVIEIEPGRDVVTLLTCTPYMINSHRLLVKGHRVPYTEKMAKAIKKADDTRKLKELLILAGVGLTVLLLLFGIYRAVHMYLLKKRRFNLNILRTDQAGNVLANREIAMYTKNGKHPVQRQGIPLMVATNEEGHARFENIPGGVYCIKDSDGLSFKVGIKKLRQDKITLYLTKQQKSYIFTNNNAVQIKK